MIAKKETKTLVSRFQQYETLIFLSAAFLSSVTAVMIIPFVNVYVRGVHDINYIRPLFGLLMSFSVFLACIKIPYEQIIYAAGRFKETRNGAFIEAGINITASIILANIIGLNGIIIGTIIALTYRLIRYYLFVGRNIISRKSGILAVKLICCGIVFGSTYIVSAQLSIDSISAFGTWLFYAAIVSCISLFIASIAGILFFKSDTIELFKLLSTKLLLLKKNT